MAIVNTRNLEGELTYRPFIIIPDYAANYNVSYTLTAKERIELLLNFKSVDQSKEKEKYSIDRLDDILYTRKFKLPFLVKATKESILMEDRLVDLDLYFANVFYSEYTADSEHDHIPEDFLGGHRRDEFSRSLTLLYRHRNEINIYGAILDKIIFTIKKAFEEEDKKRTLSIQNELDLFR